MTTPDDNASFDALVRVIESLQERIRHDGETIGSNEIRTRTALVDPLLNALGWDTTNPAMVVPEYAAGGGVADYALLKVTPDGNTPVIAFIEAKRLHEPLESHRAQMLTYANMAGVKYAGLTNGDRWELYEVFKEAPQEKRCVASVSLLHESVLDCAFRLLPLRQTNLEDGVKLSVEDGKSAADSVVEHLPLAAGVFEDELEKSLNLLQHGLLFSQRFWFSNPSVEQVRAEVNKGVSVTTTDDHGMTPLHYAVQQYHNYKPIQYLLDSGTDIMGRDSEGDTPLHSVMYPFRRWSDPDYIPDPSNWHWKDGTVGTLLAYGADATATNNNGDTPLHHAVIYGSGKIGRVFMSLLWPQSHAVELPGRGYVVPRSQGADIAAQNNQGETPLHLAVQRDLDDTFLQVFINSVVINTSDKDGNTPLHVAAFHAKKRELDDINPSWAAANPDLMARKGRSSIETLLDSGAEVDARNKKGRTPLHIAAVSSDYFTSRAGNIYSLLNRGADAAATDNDGRTSYQLAEEQGAGEEILGLLRT